MLCKNKQKGGDGESEAERTLRSYFNSYNKILDWTRMIAANVVKYGQKIFWNRTADELDVSMRGK